MHPVVVEHIGQQIDHIADLLVGPELTHSQCDFLRKKIAHLSDNVDSCEILDDE